MAGKQKSDSQKGKGVIRILCPSDLERVMEIWLQVNLRAHAFIRESYWEENFEAVKQQLPLAKVYVYEENGQIWGFVGVTDTYIAGIFVDENRCSQGIGKRLMDFVKAKHSKLTLQVYAKNERAIRFYEREGFVQVKAQMEEENQEMELVMEWTSSVS